MYSYDYWYIIYLPMDKIWGQNRSNVILACYKRQLKGKSSMNNAWQIYGVCNYGMDINNFMQKEQL